MIVKLIETVFTDGGGAFQKNPASIFLVEKHFLKQQFLIKSVKNNFF